MADSDNNDIAMAVDRILQEAGLSITDEDRQQLQIMHPHVRSMVAKLRLPETRYSQSAMVYVPSVQDPKV